METGSTNSSFQIYPNPTSGSFTLIQKEYNPSNMICIEIYNMQGQKLRTFQIMGEREKDFSVADLPAGMYFVKSTAASQTEIIRLVKTQ